MPRAVRRAVSRERCGLAGQRVLCVGVHDNGRYARKVPWYRRLELGRWNRGSRPMVAIPFSSLDRSLDEAVEFLKAHHLHRFREPPPRRPPQPLEPPRWEIR